MNDEHIVQLVKIKLQEEYNKFIEDYDDCRKACPKCGSKLFSQTLVGYILDMTNKENYKDLNRCVCGDCGDKHVFHDRVK